MSSRYSPQVDGWTIWHCMVPRPHLKPEDLELIRYAGYPHSGFLNATDFGANIWQNCVQSSLPLVTEKH